MTNADQSASIPWRKHRDAVLEVRQPREVDVLIVRSGFSGRVRLRLAGIGSFLIIEKAEDLGGSWCDNRDPGCACDIRCPSCRAAAEVQDQFFDRIQEQPRPTVWQSGRCCSWDQGRTGYNVAIAA